MQGYIARTCLPRIVGLFFFWTHCHGRLQGAAQQSLSCLHKCWRHPHGAFPHLSVKHSDAVRRACNLPPICITWPRAVKCPCCLDMHCNR